MPFKKGHKKIGGRQKDTPNRRHTIFESLDEIKTQNGKSVDVVKLFFDGLMTMPPFQRVDALLEFMKFIYPRQNNVQLSNPEGEGFRVEIVDYTKK